MNPTAMQPVRLRFDSNLESQQLPLGIFYRIRLIKNMNFSVRVKQVATQSMLIAEVSIEEGYDYMGAESPRKYAIRKAQEHFDEFIYSMLETG